MSSTWCSCHVVDKGKMMFMTCVWKRSIYDFKHMRNSCTNAFMMKFPWNACFMNCHELSTIVKCHVEMQAWFMKCLLSTFQAWFRNAYEFFASMTCFYPHLYVWILMSCTNVYAHMTPIQWINISLPDWRSALPQPWSQASPQPWSFLVMTNGWIDCIYIHKMF